MVLPWIGSELVEVYTESIEKGELPLSMRTGLVTLLYKKGNKGELSPVLSCLWVSMVRRTVLVFSLC